MKERISILLPLLLSILLFSCNKVVSSGEDPVTFLISHERGFVDDPIAVFLDLEEMENLYGNRDFSHYALRDLNNDEELYFRLLDDDKDQLADYIVFTFTPIGNEPLRPFGFREKEDASEIQMIAGSMAPNEVELRYLIPAPEVGNMHELNWPEKVAGTFMETYKDPCSMEIFAPGRWTYTNGFFNNALCEMYRSSNDSKYLDYVRNWADCYVGADGSIRDYVQSKYRLDDILPGRTLLYLYEESGTPDLEAALDYLMLHLEHQPRTSEGGYWHKEIYAHQMWLDGIYMGDVFTAQYASLFNRPELYDEVVLQVELMFKHTFDEATGLMYHGWDESINDIWSDPITGASPEFWGRGMGWYMMALVDVLDYLPEEHPGRSRVIDILNKVAAGVAVFQDPSSDLWYQVLDKGDQQGNWIETSCSAMFAYAFAKGARMTYLDPIYLEKAKKAFDGLLNEYVYLDDAGRFYLTSTVKVGTLNFKNSDGSYNYYIGVDRRVNDFKGVSAFLYLAMEMNKN